MRPRKFNSNFPKAGSYGIQRGVGNTLTIVKSLRDCENWQGSTVVFILHSNYYPVSATERRHWWIGNTVGISKKEMAKMGITLNEH